MPARFYPFVNNYYYHIFNRGVNKQPIFNGIIDFKRAVNLLRFYSFKDYPIRFSKFLLLSSDQRKEIWTRLSNSQKYSDIISYCFMPNHFHLLLKQNIDKGISKFMANFQNSYTKYFNLKNDRVGHLFQGQFKAVKIDSEEQLLHVSRYIHLNPFSSGLMEKIDDLSNYKWSSFPEYITDVPFEICNKDVVLASFKNRNTYKEFAFDNADYQKNLENIKHLTLD